jgi:hypothetical protein
MKTVRKRIITGLLAVLVIGVAAFLPKKGTVEWHKREYFIARDGSKAGNAVRSAWRAVTGRPWYHAEKSERMGMHYLELMKLGYLKERVFVVSNTTPAQVADRLLLTFGTVFTNDPWGLSLIDDIGSNSVTVIAPYEDRSKWEELIRRSDVPESGE